MKTIPLPRLFPLTLLAFGLASCVPPPFAEESTEPVRSAVAREDELLTTNGLSSNGLSTNGLTTNGLTTNGLTTNGLTTNGLTTNGLATTSFKTWFNLNPSYSDMVMRYVMRCALPFGAIRNWTNPTTGATFTWFGLFGLAPKWAGGGAIPLVEQQLMTGCLAAHVNKYGVAVPISALGQRADGTTLLGSDFELTTFSVKEGCFFGNLFNGEGIYAGNDSTLKPSQSSARACALSSGHASVECPPIADLGEACGKACVRESGVKAAFVTCTKNGVTYKPITTRLLPETIYSCGDGICQFTEKCGTLATSSGWDNCGLDCGICAP